jgi:hypothetical protein
VCVFAFDLLYLNGESLVKEPLRRRSQLLRESFETVEGQFQFAQSIQSSNVDDIQTFLDDSIKGLILVRILNLFMLSTSCLILQYFVADSVLILIILNGIKLINISLRESIYIAKLNLHIYL